MWQSIRASVLGRHVHEEAYAALVLSGGYEEAGARAERAIRFCSLIPPMSPQIDFRAAAARANAEIVGGDLVAKPKEWEFLLQAIRMKSKIPEAFLGAPELQAAVGQFSGKWKVRIICLLFDGTKRFGELRRSLPGIHRGTLTYELHRLVVDGIIRRTQYVTIPPMSNTLSPPEEVVCSSP